MKQSTLAQLHNYYTAVIPFCNKQKGLNLLHSLGYDTNVFSPETCMRATTEYGSKFFTPFLKIANEAVNSPKFNAHANLVKREKLSLDKATKDGSMTSAEQTQKAFDFIKLFTDTAQTYMNSEANKKQADAEYQRTLNEAKEAETEANKEENSSNKTIIIAVCCVFAVLVIAIGCVAIFRKK
jgi:hypothetical protein